ncbi:MAG TPA: nickel pincer cofactor biosynthesis protein LarC, partial [Spirochaetota bacterium]|nr:nickel pincer cofactor biosynthesis protein LarC [Spirochaetota bacterium]
MNALYIDAFSGVSGDKFVAALLEISGKFDFLKEQLKSLNIEDEYNISLTQKNVMGISSNYFKVTLLNEENHSHEHDDHFHEVENFHTNHHEHSHNHEDHHHKNKHEHTHKHIEKHIHRNLSDITKIIADSKITENAKKISLGIFNIIALAEAKVHGKSVEQVHFHEVGATDSIIDIVSTAILLDQLKIDKFISSPIPTGFGFVNISHGRLPIPAPATLEILKGVPTYQSDIEGELTTPTGAAIIKYLVKEFGKQPQMTVDKTGYGAGTKEFTIPNVLRLYLGEESFDNKKDIIIKLETNIDDATPQEIGFLFELLFENNALDVFSTPILMKKNRLATLLTVLCYENNRELIEKLIFKHSSTFGIRKTLCERTILDRKFETITIDGLEVKIKIGYYDDEILKKIPEYEDIKKLSLKLSLNYHDTI